MKSLFDGNTLTEIRDRLNLLNPKSQALWGKMDVGQMLAHCQQPLLVSLGRGQLKPRFFPLAFLFKKMLYNDNPWKKNLPTTKSFKITDPRQFHTEKAALEILIDEFYTRKNEKHWDPHPVFGNFTVQQWGQMQYKHLDHHLKQFGV